MSDFPGCILIRFNWPIPIESMGLVSLPIHENHKNSTIHVSTYAIVPWILWVLWKKRNENLHPTGSSKKPTTAPYQWGISGYIGVITPFTNHLPTSWDIQTPLFGLLKKKIKKKQPRAPYQEYPPWCWSLNPATFRQGYSRDVLNDNSRDQKMMRPKNTFSKKKEAVIIQPRNQIYRYPKLPFFIRF